MDITLENLGPSVKLMKVQVPSQRVKSALDEFYALLSPRAKVPGFRPGKVPRPILEKNFQSEAKKEVSEKVIAGVYKEVVDEKQLRPALPAMLMKMDWKLDDSLYFEMRVDLIPDFKLPSYKGIAVEVAKQEVPEGEVEKYLQHLQDNHAELIPREGRAAMTGDVVMVDQRLSVGETLLEESKGLAYPLDEQKMMPEMRKALEGAKAGDLRDVAITVPEQYPKKEWVGKQATLTLAVQEVKERKLPELTDEFARDMVGDCENLADLKNKIRANIEKYRAEMAALETQGKINEYLVKNVRMDLSERLVDLQKDSMHHSAQERGQAPKEPDEAYWKDLAGHAEGQLKLHFAYLKIAEAEKLEPGEADAEKKIAEIAAKIGQSPAVVREYYKKDGRMDDLMERLTKDKVAEFLIAQAKITAVPSQGGKKS